MRNAGAAEMMLAGGVGALRRGRRVFDVVIGGDTVLESFDVCREAGGRQIALVKEFDVSADEGWLSVALSPRIGLPILSGLEAAPRSAPGFETREDPEND